CRGDRKAWGSSSTWTTQLKRKKALRYPWRRMYARPSSRSVKYPAGWAAAARGCAGTCKYTSSMVMAMAAVTTSTRKMTSSDVTLSSSALTMGDTNVVADWMVLLIALTLVSMAGGTNWGSKAPTAGIWMPPPNARTAEATNN